MDESRSLDKVVVGVKRAITAKAIISAASIGMLIPFVKLIYWIFDSSYLSGFGISPDVYSRPIFASGFVSTWLVAESLGVMIVGWSILAIVIFIVLTSINITPRKFFKIETPVENGEEVISAQSSLRARIIDFLKRVSDAANRSMEWPAIIWGAGLSLVLFLALTTVWASEKGSELAKSQRDFYLELGVCADKFNSSNIGCFTINGIEGSGHFIIANPKTHLIYLSRECVCGEDCKLGIELTILEKNPSAQYSIVREFVPSESSGPPSGEGSENDDGDENVKC